MMMATIVQTKELLQTVAWATGTGVGVTVVFSIAVYGAIRFVDLNRDERPLAAGLAGVMTAVALAACAAAVVIGIVVMTKK